MAHRLRDQIVDGATLTAAAAAVLLSAMVVVDRRVTTPRERPATQVDNWREYAAAGHSAGSDSAAVTIVVFGDYECPACRSFERIMEKVLAADASPVRVVYRHLPLDYHPNAYAAARAAECAGVQGRFLQYHRQLYATTPLSVQSWMSIAAKVEVPDTEAFSACIEADDPVPAVDADIAAGRAVGARGTPAILVNDLLLGSVPDSAELTELLGRARRLAAR